jgi:hypothetical protein
LCSLKHDADPPPHLAGKCGECGERPSTTRSCVDQLPPAHFVPCTLGPAACILRGNHTGICICETPLPRARKVRKTFEGAMWVIE